MVRAVKPFDQPVFGSRIDQKTMMCVCADVDDGDANFIVTGWGNETRIKFQFHSIEFSTASPVPLHVLENPERSRSFLDKETGS